MFRTNEFYAEFALNVGGKFPRFGILDWTGG